MSIGQQPQRPHGLPYEGTLAGHSVRFSVKQLGDSELLFEYTGPPMDLLQAGMATNELLIPDYRRCPRSDDQGDLVRRFKHKEGHWKFLRY